MSIFKAYDVRGVYPKEINEEVIYKIGRSYVNFLKEETNKNDLKITIGRDVRLSSDSLAAALIEGIMDEGARVFDIGVATTPRVYFACGFYDYDGSIMITASHNPKEYNGLKFTREKAIPIGVDTGLKKIEGKVLENKFNNDKKGQVIEKNIESDYFEKILSYVGNVKKIKVVVDTANSVGMLEADILKDIMEIVPLYFELDGNFPNHEANPLKIETLKDLQDKVTQEKADLGIAFDGDADRVGFVNEKGEIITSDIITALIAKNVLFLDPNKTILYDLRSSKVVKEVIEAFGGKAVMCRVGHAFIKKQLKDEDGVFAGELSGHYYFKDLYYAESSILAIINILSLMSRENKPISEIVNPLKKYFHTGEINFEVEVKDKVINSLERKYYAQAKNRFKLDGLSIEFKDWWFNVRPSNTEPLLRLNLEANTKELMEYKKEEVIKVINS